jgi:two-component system sensor histidine kinase UhpB
VTPAPPTVRRASTQAALGPALVAAAYYLGAQVGFALQSPNAPQSVLWLPNSILLAVLLIVPPHRWLAYLAAAFPAQMLMAWGTHQPLLAMALLFMTNCADAALGAFLVRRAMGGAPFRFDSLRSTLVFMAAASGATILLSFADAGISVATGWIASPYLPFVTRVRSNILTHLIVVPAILDLTAVKWRTIPPARWLEAVVLAALLGVSCVAAFGRAAGSHAFPAVVNLPLPLLLWAAARFGPGGIGCSTLLVAGLASWTALRGHGPFSSSSPLDGVVSLQLFLLASATPLLVLAAVIRERNEAADALRDSESALRQSYVRLRELAGKLIAAQEMERASIARDLHDDFNQQLAALAIGISQVRHRTGPDQLDDGLRQLHERTVALTEKVRSFSHQLHPQKLDHVGLAAALRTHCAHVSEQQGLRISFVASDDLSTLPRETALCIYRIVQEALRNIVHHANVRDASVSVVRSGDRLQLTIVDCGRGFELASVAGSRGLGLLSMQERARACGGALTITSAPGRGTTLRMHLPVVEVPA